MLDTGCWMLDSLSVGIQYLVSGTKSIFFGADKQIGIYRDFTGVQMKFLLDLFLYIWAFMQSTNVRGILVENKLLESTHLEREVKVDFYLPATLSGEPSLLLINDGQNMEELGLAEILEGLNNDGEIRPLICVAIHAGIGRKLEYGTAGIPDYRDRGTRAENYTSFVFEELLPYIRQELGIAQFVEKAFAGFSLGGLSALDIVWNYPHEFSCVGVFSGSLWWRTKGLAEGYDESKDRIMHGQIRNGNYAPWLRFFFETGTMDESMDRNNNGVIDSIDDTLSLIDELVEKGYNREKDIYYLELKDGKHDIPTWGRAMPTFLKWAFRV